MKGRIWGIIIGCILVVGGALLVVLFQFSLPFVAAILLGCAGIFAIAWGGMYFERNFPRGKVVQQKEKCVDICSELLGNAEESIAIVSGALYPGFYDNQRILDAFRKALKKRARIEIVCGPHVDKITSKVVKLAKDNGNFTICYLPYYPKAHFMIVDRRSVRKDKEHSERLSLDAEMIGTVYYDRPFLATQLGRIFEALKSKATCTSEEG